MAKLVKDAAPAPATDAVEAAGVAVPEAEAVTGAGFTATAVPANAKGEGARPNLVEKRQEKIQAAIAANAPFTYVRKEDGVEFACICGSVGKNAHVLQGTTGEVKVGDTCLKYCKDAEGNTITPPKAEKKERTQAPGVSRTDRLKEYLAKFVAPFTFKEEREGEFRCACGGRGKNQVVGLDANGAEIILGHNCAKAAGIPLPAKEPKRQTKAKVAGLKGGVAAGEETADAFTEVG